ncbi:hypothetical protein PD280_09690 [Virgibacillus salarius]|nr:hypothetical protein [Virgibacillus salarius]WBX81898.1 hypothetical protein PD280_09690 [Virgibacillus salarius]
MKKVKSFLCMAVLVMMISLVHGNISADSGVSIQADPDLGPLD